MATAAFRCPSNLLSTGNHLHLVVSVPFPFAAAGTLVPAADVSSAGVCSLWRFAEATGGGSLLGPGACLELAELVDDGTY